MNFATDPLLGSVQPQHYTTNDLLTANEEMAARLSELRQRKINLRPQSTQSPVWDEVDKIMDSLTDGQKMYLQSNQEYVDSNASVVEILNREYLKVMRPIVESTKDGKDALERHLTLLKRLRKSAMQEEEQKNALMDDYMKNHSDMTWKDYMALKQKKTGGKR